MVAPEFLPHPVRVAVSFGEMLSKDFVVKHLAPSALRVGAAFLISALVALPLGLLCGQVMIVYRILHPLLAFTRYLPVPAFVPLCILWFGIGHEQKAAVIVLGVVFQLVILLSDDSAAVPPEWVDAGRTFGWSKAKILRRVVWPAALPSFWDHLRVAAGWAWSYVVLAELVAGNEGVGYFIVEAQRYNQTSRVFAGILFVGLLGGLTDLAFQLAGRKIFRWQ
jgi:NitT/TauT family transport system permease protein